MGLNNNNKTQGQLIREKCKFTKKLFQAKFSRSIYWVTILWKMNFRP